MEHQLGRIDIVAWQDRRLHGGYRPPLGSLALAAVFGLSGLVLLLRLLGAPLPLGALQIAFAALAASAAMLLTRGVAGLFLKLQHR